MIEAGKLRHIVTVQRPSGTRMRDAVGAKRAVFDDVAVVHASIEPLSGREEFFAAQRQASTTHKIRVRYAQEIAAMDATWRIKFNQRTFTLDEPPRNTDEMNAELVIMATEGPREE